MNYIRLPLEGAKNVRDLGGYATKNGRITKFHVFIRSNRLKNITDADNEFLKNYNITDIIDLRGKTAIQDTFVSDDNIKPGYFNFHYLPLCNKELEDFLDENLWKEDFDFGEGYYLLLNNKEKIKEIFNILINSEGGVLFHCTAGKDRTGVIAALILGVCDVEDIDIIANYEVTNTYIEFDGCMDSYVEPIKKSNVQFIKTFIQRLKDKYGSYENYLVSCGIELNDIEKLRSKFCEKI